MSSLSSCISLALLTLTTLVACNKNSAPLKEAAIPAQGQDPTLRLTSPGFAENGMIPPKYTCDGKNMSTPLAWSGAPSGTKSFALIVHDPDAPPGDFTHWVLYDLPASANNLPENVLKENRAQGGAQGMNDFGKVGYGGPCPPSGTHRYVFTLYALDAQLGLAPRASRAQVEAAIKGHLLAQTELTGKYGR